MKCESINCQNEVHTLNDNGYYCWKCIDDAIVNETFKLSMPDKSFLIGQDLPPLIPETTEEEYTGLAGMCRKVSEEQSKTDPEFNKMCELMGERLENFFQEKKQVKPELIQDETTEEEYKAFIKKARSMTLPTDSAERKNYPLLRGCLKYFSAALAGVARISKLGNDKHNPGEDMHHARGKSSDHGDCIIRHLMDTEDLIAAQKRGDTTITDQQILDEANQMAWRALAYCQELHEAKGAPMASGARK